MNGTFDFHGDDLDRKASKARAEAGAEQADDNAAEAWRKAADDVMHWCAKTYPTFTSDQFWARAKAVGMVETHERRAMSGVVARAKRSGWIIVTNEMRTSARKLAHSNPKRVYLSQLVEGDNVTALGEGRVVPDPNPDDTDRVWRDCERIRFCTEHEDFHPPQPVRRYETDQVGCSPDSWRSVQVKAEKGLW